MPAPFRQLARFADGAYVDRDACDAAFARMHRRDAIGDRVHLALACLGLFLVAGPVTVTELAFAPLLVFFFVRSLNTAPVWIHGFGQPAVLVAGALAAWLSLSLAWSADPAQGLDEIVRMRWVLLVGLIYPAIERRHALVTALALGLIVSGIAQLVSGFDALRPPFPFRHPGRVTGWWDPVVAGSVQVGALGLFLPAALRGHGRDRWIGTFGVAVSAAGLLATGTRGAWISGLLLVVIATPVVLRGAGRRARRIAVAGGVAGLIALLAAGWTHRDGIILRVDQARAELTAAGEGDLDSPTGARIAAMGVAAESGLTRPWGLGAGGLRTAAADRYGQEHTVAYLEHAHCSPLHLWGVGGVIGLGLGALFAWVVLRAGLHAAPADPARALEAGVPFAFAGILLAGLFDAVHINTHTGALIGVLAALSPAYRPGRRTEQAAG